MLGINYIYQLVKDYLTYRKRYHIKEPPIQVSTFSHDVMIKPFKGNIKRYCFKCKTITDFYTCKDCRKLFCAISTSHKCL